MNQDFTAPIPASVPILGTDRRFPLRRIFCIGRNHAAHGRETEAKVERSSPVFFCKPADAVVTGDLIFTDTRAGAAARGACPALPT